MEKWRPVVGYEGCYEVSDLGNVRTVARHIQRKSDSGWLVKPRLLRPSTGGLGYLTLVFSAKGRSITRNVHRLVAEAFLPRCSLELIVNHRNGIKSDNRLENLEWVSKSHDLRHAYDTGLRTVTSAQRRQGRINILKFNSRRKRAAQRTSAR